MAMLLPVRRLRTPHMTMGRWPWYAMAPHGRTTRVSTPGGALRCAQSTAQRTRGTQRGSAVLRTRVAVEGTWRGGPKGGIGAVRPRDWHIQSAGCVSLQFR